MKVRSPIGSPKITTLFLVMGWVSVQLFLVEVLGFAQSQPQGPSSVPELLQEIRTIQPGFFSDHASSARTISSDIDWDSAYPVHGIPDAERAELVHGRPDKRLTITEVDIKRPAFGRVFITNSIEVTAVLCDKSTALIKETASGTLKEAGFEDSTWTDTGFLFTKKYTRGEAIPGPAPLFEDIRVVLKVDQLDHGRNAVTVLYEVTAGPREHDSEGWKDQTTVQSCQDYIDRLRVRLAGAILQAIHNHCKRVEGRGNSVAAASKKAKMHLSHEQKADFTRNVQQIEKQTGIFK